MSQRLPGKCVKSLASSNDRRRYSLLRHTEKCELKYSERSGRKVFETIKGSSRIIKGVLTEQDILAAPMKAPSVELQRPVGAARPPASSAKPSRGSVHSMKSYM